MTMACFLENITSFLENMPIGTERRRGEDRNDHGMFLKKHNIFLKTRRSRQRGGEATTEMTIACFLAKIQSFLENTPIGMERRRGDDTNDHGMFSRKDTIYFRKHTHRDGEAERRRQK